jgi:hypothetical protein
LEPFNLREEREGGNFDASMNYVWRKETGEVDRWIADLDEAEMEKSIGEAAKSLKVASAPESSSLIIRRESKSSWRWQRRKLICTQPKTRRL